VDRLLREMEKQVDTMKVNDASSQTIPLTPEQAGDIAELMRAYHASLDISTESDPPRDRANMSDLVNIAELSVRRVIAMAKQVCVAVVVVNGHQKTWLLVIQTTFDKFESGIFWYQLALPCSACSQKST